MAEKKPKTKSITITLPQGNFPVVFYANRCGVEEEDGHKLVYFGFVRELDKIEHAIGVFACIFEKQMLANQKIDWLAFLNEIGYPSDTRKLNWRPTPGSILSVPLVNAAALARTDDNAEMRCYNFSAGDAAAMGKEIAGGPIVGQAIALLRCPADLLRHLLLALFDAGELL
jgi:hypothetical protein